MILPSILLSTRFIRIRTLPRDSGFKTRRISPPPSRRTRLVARMSSEPAISRSLSRPDCGAAAEAGAAFRGTSISFGALCCGTKRVPCFLCGGSCLCNLLRRRSVRRLVRRPPAKINDMDGHDLRRRGCARCILEPARRPLRRASERAAMLSAVFDLSMPASAVTPAWGPISLAVFFFPSDFSSFPRASFSLSSSVREAEGSCARRPSHGGGLRSGAVESASRRPADSALRARGLCIAVCADSASRCPTDSSQGPYLQPRRGQQ